MVCSVKRLYFYKSDVSAVQGHVIDFDTNRKHVGYATSY